MYYLVHIISSYSFSSESDAAELHSSDCDRINPSTRRLTFRFIGDLFLFYFKIVLKIVNFHTLYL